MQKIPTEKVEGEQFRWWLESEGYKYTHIANEIGIAGKVGMLVNKAKKSQGLKKWVPDYMIILKRWSLLFIELKRRKKILKNWKLWASPSKVSDEQKEWIKALSQVENVEAKIAHWWEEAVRIVEEMENF